MTVSSEEPQPSIAVLPFVNMSGDKEQEYFSDGLAEEIINALTKIPGLQVIARTSAFAFKGKQEDIRKIAEVLGVANILEGSVRKSGNRIRVTAQLIEAFKGIHLWSERYDRDLTDVFEIQDEIAAAIVGTLRIKLSTKLVPRHHEPNLAAHEAYLKARHLFGRFNPDSIEQTKAFLEKAISMDPQYALAHCGLADLYLFLGIGSLPANETMPIIREEARKALSIDPSLPEAYALLGIVAAKYDYDWKEAEKQFSLAMAHETVPPLVRQWYAYFYLMHVGRTEECILQHEQGIKGDPLNVIGRSTFAVSLLAAGRIADAHSEAMKVLEIDEAKESSFLNFSFIYARQKNWKETLYNAEEASRVVPWTKAIAAAALRKMGEENRAEEVIQNLMHTDKSFIPIGLAIYHSICDETEKATKWWEKAIEQRHSLVGQMIRIFFRSNPEWPAMAKLMNLPGEAL